ncbi:MAG: ARMT1-like domain-containing protein [Chloroflexota bacterium]|nr:ARMT1-like domain-containing protein [Chloroflexota bacterium]
MKAVDECYSCLSRLVRQAARLATTDEELRAEALSAGMNVLAQDFSTDALTLNIATSIHSEVKRVTGNPDPYHGMKETEMRLSRELSAQMGSYYLRNLKGYLSLSVLGNSIDFFRDFDDVKSDMETPLQLAVDDSDAFQRKLDGARSLLFLADNAGEVFFDLPLVEWLARCVPVTYVVKEAPVQNDTTIDDLRRAGLDGRLGRVITTGLAMPGVIFDLASKEFRRAFEEADVILAKGMGHWEGLSELPAEGRILHCSMAKCRPVADSMGVPLNSYVTMLR